jgi:para-aminobenzoate synthetase component 1
MGNSAPGFALPAFRRQVRAVARADEIMALLGAPAQPGLPAMPPLAWRPALGQGEYEDRVRQILALIRAGDIFQANFTTAFTAARPAGLSAAALYLALREASPAPFGAFIDGGGHALASASPERFVSLQANGRIEARPIKGTAARAADPLVDAGLRAALRGSAKDRAENLMITDLLRNDIGRVSCLGSVAVEALGALESFANLHHLVSVITAELQPGLTAIDLVRAVFPGGSVTGAPKIRAMEIIDEMEVCARGAYCGAIAWLGFDGAMDSSIVIRTITLTPETLIAQAGGAIVAESQAAAEYAEMLLKIAPLLGLGR